MTMFRDWLAFDCLALVCYYYLGLLGDTKTRRLHNMCVVVRWWWFSQCCTAMRQLLLSVPLFATVAAAFATACTAPQLLFITKIAIRNWLRFCVRAGCCRWNSSHDLTHMVSQFWPICCKTFSTRFTLWAMTSIVDVSFVEAVKPSWAMSLTGILIEQMR